MALVKKIYNDGKELFFEIHLIGYKNQGESILFFIKYISKLTQKIHVR